jgi:hypothetical protein
VAESIINRLRHAWNAFQDGNQSRANAWEIGPGSGIRPDISHLRGGAERSIVSSIYNRIALDVASISLQHVRLDQNGSYLETIDSGLNDCLTLEANIDQTGRAFILDVVLSMFDEGCVAIVPVDTTLNPAVSTSWDVKSMRTAKIVAWYPQHVRVYIYNDRKGLSEEIVVPKKDVAIVENPFYKVMNEPNSTLKRLINKLNLLDAIDQQSGSGKLDLIIQLPYVIKTEARRKQADERRKDLEEQLSGSKYGIGYTDGTEKVTQLNRPAENNLMKQIEFLTSMLYSQLGIDQSVFNGTANETTMLNYHSRTVEPIAGAIADSLRRSMLTKTARAQGQSIMYFKNPFSLVSSADMASLSDALTRNAIFSANDIRSIFGYRPDDDPASSKLSNKNLNPPATSQASMALPSGRDMSGVDPTKGDVTNG